VAVRAGTLRSWFHLCGNLRPNAVITRRFGATAAGGGYGWSVGRTRSGAPESSNCSCQARVVPEVLWQWEPWRPGSVGWGTSTHCHIPPPTDPDAQRVTHENSSRY